MSIIIVLLSILIPIGMIFTQVLRPRLEMGYRLLAYVAALVFGNISAIAIYEIIRDETVFMTNIHALFLNPYFLITGAYLGIFLLYSLLATLLKR